MLVAIDSDLQDAKLVERAAKVLNSGGKVVILAAKDQAAEDTWRDDCLRQLKIESSPAATWQAQPVGHWQASTAKGTVILVPDAQSFRNASFERPERAPSSAQAKWLGHLYRWLFEQP